MLSRREQYFAGVRAGLPIIIGYVSIGLAYGVMMRQAGQGAGPTVLMSATVLAGASQMMAAGMLAAKSGVLAIVVATFVLNLRHLIMSTCVLDRIKEPEKLGLRLLGAFAITDESFGVFMTTEADRCSLPYLLGIDTVIYFSWVLGSAIGAFASAFLPPLMEKSLSIALYAMFIGLLLPSLRGKKKLIYVVLLAAGMNILLSKLIPGSWALIASTLLAAYLGSLFVGEEEAA